MKKTLSLATVLLLVRLGGLLYENRTMQLSCHLSKYRLIEIVPPIQNEGRNGEQMNNKRKILIADDEQYVRLLVKSALGTSYSVLEASDGEEALDITRTEKPDLVLMDILMPKLDGYTACYAIKTDEATKAIPVVMLTGIGHALNKKLSQEMGADGYITKPFNLQALLDKVKQCEPVTSLTAS